ncbi:hypothetical protein [Burkholderia sp. SCN-KJ]|uniref:hypothetical protein n=1 Tax=Burkholderia sp. SCN-KJ TaxID=2969248 RepID=UPI0021502D96|nr:hypothetical protein [Burkholderia sp. SCN-KJ]MCR4471161.1 hypothetical protein [Burkholderia sp. SCN-KJ]
MHNRPQPVSAYCAAQSPDVEATRARPDTMKAAREGVDRRGGRPRILTEMQDRLDAYLDDPDRHLPTLNAANGSARRQRLERRVACVQLLRAMLKYLDLASLRIGIPQRDGGFLSLTLPFLAKHACLPVRRAERAMRDLLRAGLVTAQQRAERTDDGGYRGLASLRQLPAALFGAFGLSKWLRHERSKAVMRRYRASAEAAKAEREQLRDSQAEAQASLAFSAIAQRLKRPRSARAPAAGETSTVATDHAEAIARRVGTLKLLHPDWDRERCYDAAYRELE